MKRFFLSCLLFVFVVMQANTQTIIRGPYLQNPNWNSMKVKWRTDSAIPSKLKWGLSPNALSNEIFLENLTIEHTVAISGLEPSTTYYYGIYNEAGSLLEGEDELHRFKTWPLPGTVEPIRVWGIGDFGKGNSRQTSVWKSYFNYPGAGETDLWLWFGDNVYDEGNDMEYQTKVFDGVYGYDSVFNFLPFMPSPGNHDYEVISPVTSPVNPENHSGPYFDIIDVPTNGESGGVPSGTELYYSFDYGNVHFVSINSEIGSLFNPGHDWIGIGLLGGFNGSPFTQWLEADLQANTKPWTIAYFHQPPHTDGSHESGSFWEVFMKAMREKISPILEQYGVDMVLCGHSHVYERSCLVKGFYGDLPSFNPQTMIINNNSGIDSLGQAYIKYTQGSKANVGTMYVVNGNSGSVDSDAGLNHPIMKAAYGCDTCIGSLILDIFDNRIDGKHLSGYGQIMDHFTIIKTADTTLTSSISPIPVAQAEVISDISIFPNPFGKTTTLAFTLKMPEKIRIGISDEHEKMKTVYEGKMSKGEHKITIDAEKLGLTSGLYGISIATPKKVLSRKVVYLK